MESLSTSENTATDWMPISRHVRITRTAISARLATRTFLIGPVFVVFDRFIVVGEYAMRRNKRVCSQRTRPYTAEVRSLVAAAAAFIALACAACPAHVLFDAPPPASAPEEMRTAYYSQHA